MVSFSTFTMIWLNSVIIFDYICCCPLQKGKKLLLYGTNGVFTIVEVVWITIHVKTHFAGLHRDASSLFMYHVILVYCLYK